MLTIASQKTQENRLRRLARRQGLHLVKSRSRTPELPGYGCFLIANEDNVLVAHDTWRTLDEVEHYLVDEDD